MVSIQRILCPVDFSEASEHAAAHALALARAFHASITALHVRGRLPVSVYDLRSTSEGVDELERLRQDTRQCFAQGADVPVETLVEIGQPDRHILRRAGALGADLIVMGTHGTSGFEHLMLGSVTERVLRAAACPVLTVPPRAQATSTLPFRRVLCAIDFSEPSLAGLDLARAVADDAAATLTMVHVIEWPWEEPPAPEGRELPPPQAAALAEYRRYLECSAAARLRSLVPSAPPRGLSPSTRVVHGKPWVEILRLADSVGADLIVMGVHGRNAADVMLFGSTTNQVVRRATCPVLTLRR